MAEENKTFNEPGIQFRKALFKTCQQLQTNDVEAMKFFIAGLDNKPGFADLENTKTSISFFMILVKYDLIRENDVSFLENLLENIGQISLISQLRKDMKEVSDSRESSSGHNTPSSSSQDSPHSTPGSSLEYAPNISSSPNDSGISCPQDNNSAQHSEAAHQQQVIVTSTPNKQSQSNLGINDPPVNSDLLGSSGSQRNNKGHLSTGPPVVDTSQQSQDRPVSSSYDGVTLEHVEERGATGNVNSSSKPSGQHLQQAYRNEPALENHASGGLPPGYPRTDQQMVMNQQHLQIPPQMQNEINYKPFRQTPIGLQNEHRQDSQRQLTQFIPLQNPSNEGYSQQVLPAKFAHSASWPEHQPTRAPPPGFPSLPGVQQQFGYHPLTSSEVHQMHHQTNAHQENFNRSISAPVPSDSMGPTLQTPSISLEPRANGNQLTHCGAQSTNMASKDATGHQYSNAAIGGQIKHLPLHHQNSSSAPVLPSATRQTPGIVMAVRPKTQQAAISTKALEASNMVGQQELVVRPKEREPTIGKRLPADYVLYGQHNQEPQKPVKSQPANLDKGNASLLQHNNSGTVESYSSYGGRLFKPLSSHPEQFDRRPLQGILNHVQMESIVEKSDPDTSDYGGEILAPSKASSASVESVGNRLHDLSLDAEKGDRSASYDLETDAPQESLDESALNLGCGYNKSILSHDEHRTNGVSSAQQYLSEDGSIVINTTSKMQEDKMERLKAKVQRNLAEQRARKGQGLVQPSFDPVPDKSTKKTKLRNYQEELAAPAMNGGNYIICAPTGCGKTLTAAAICRKRYDVAMSRGNGFKALFIVNMRHLTEQQTIAFQDTFPDGTVGTVGETDILSKVFYGGTYAVVMITAQILLNALRRKEPDIHLGDISMIIFDECHHTTQDHPYNDIMKLYLRTKKTKLGSDGVLGKSGRYLPQILGLSASLGVGHGRDAYKHVLTLCGNLDAANVVQVLHNKDELEEFVNSPELDKIQYVHPRQTKGGEFFKIVDKIMSDVEKEIWPNGVPENHGTSSYEQWAVERRKEAEESRERVQLVACLYLFEFNRSLMLFDELRAKDALRHLEAFMEKRDIKQNPVPIEEICRVYFHGNVERLRRLAAAEEGADNPKLDALGKLLKKKFMETPKSKGIILTRTRLNTEALTDFIERTAHLKHLQQPVKPTRLVGQGQNTETERYMTEHEQKVSLQRFREDESCNLLVATDIAQEGLDMPACNFVIRYNFVSNEIGTVQSKGRARAKQSECFLIVEQNSKTAERELQNRQNVIDMQEAMNRLNALAEKERMTEVAKRQDEAYREMVRKEESTKARKGMYKPEDVGLFCKECNSYITQASYIRRKECHYTCIDPNLRNTIRIVEKPGRKFRTTINAGVFKCAKEDCGQQLGTAIDFLDKDGETVLLHGFGFRVESFLFKLPDGTPKTYKKWKVVPADFPEHEAEELVPLLFLSS